MLSQVHQNVAYRIVIRTFEFTVFPLNRLVIFYLKVENLVCDFTEITENSMSYFFSECKPAWLANATVMCYYLSTSLCHVIYKYVMPNQNLIPYSYFITDWYKKNTHNEVFINFTSRNWHHIRWDHFWRKIRLRYVLTLMFCTKKQFRIFGFNVSSHFTLHWYLIRTGFGCLVPNYTDAHTHMRKQ